MALKFVTDLPEDEVKPRAGHTDTARELRENPTSNGWADISPEPAYTNRATATKLAKEINEHTHKAFRDYGFEARVVSSPLLDADGGRVMVDEVKKVKDADGNETGETKTRRVPGQLHQLFARYNLSLPGAGTLAPVKEAAAEVASAPVTASAATPVAPAAPVGDSAVKLPAMDATPTRRPGAKAAVASK